MKINDAAALAFVFLRSDANVRFGKVLYMFLIHAKIKDCSMMQRIDFFEGAGWDP